MLRPLALLAIGLFFVGRTPAYAASPWHDFADPVFVHADTRELSDSAVMAVAQDTAGFVWVGTQGGLARFDGYHFRNFLPNPNDETALPDGYIRTLLADDAGGVWIGSSSNGLVHFDAATETFHTWPRDQAGRTGPRSAVVDALANASDGDVWVGGDGGLSRFDPPSGRFTPVPLAPRGRQPRVWSVTVDHSGWVWAGTDAGLFVERAGSDRFEAFRLPGGAPVAAHAITSIYEDRSRRLWVGSLGLLVAIDPQRRSGRAFHGSGDDAAALAPGPAWSITEMTPGVLWIGSDASISILDIATGRMRRIDADMRNPGGLPGGRVLQFLHDRSGLVWLANHVGGLLAYNPDSHGLYQLPATQPKVGFDDEGAVSLAATADGVWAGGFRGRFAHLEPRGMHSMVMHIADRGVIQALLLAHDGTLWIGTGAGLCRLRAGETSATCPPWPSDVGVPSIYTMLEHDGRIWIGGASGVLVYDPATGTARPFAGTSAFANGQVRTLFFDREGRLWAGTENGIDRIDRDGHVVRLTYHPGDPDSIGPGGFATMIEDARGRIWAGANGGPLDVLPANGRGPVRRLGLADGLPHENVDGLAEDGAGRIWASTDKGTAVFDPRTLRARALGAADGVSGGGYWGGTVSRAGDGTIYFGGVDGITVITPGADSPWTYAPPLVATELSIGRHAVPAWAINRGDGDVRLPADARDISVEFAALDFSAPQALRYEYRLEGYDSDWVHADPTHRMATYTHLSPGTYTLDVRGTNRLGVWSSKVLQLRFDALPLWYETWWFRIVLIAAIALVAYGTLRVRTAVLRRRQHELEALVGERTAELSEANAKLRELSLSDPLTGLRNRRFLDQHLESDVAMTLRLYENWAGSGAADPPSNSDIVFFVIDLDNFKIINDRFGHHGGDVMLMQMRERLLEVFRESDFVVRWGGDEFLTVARGSARGDAPMLAERIRVAVASRPFVISETQMMEASVSVGFAAFPFIPSDPDAVSWFQVVALADQALYMAKQAGRNAWFGLAATPATDPTMIGRRIEGTAEELVRGAALDVLTRDVPAEQGATEPRST